MISMLISILLYWSDFQMASIVSMIYCTWNYVYGNELFISLFKKYSLTQKFFGRGENNGLSECIYNMDEIRF